MKIHKLCQQLPPPLLGRSWATLAKDQAPSGSLPHWVHEVVQGMATLAALVRKGPSHPTCIFRKFWGSPDFPGAAERIRQQETQQKSVPHLEHNVSQKPPRRGRPGRMGRGRPRPAASDRQLSCLRNHSSAPCAFQARREPRLLLPPQQREQITGWRGQPPPCKLPQLLHWTPLIPERIEGKTRHC